MTLRLFVALALAAALVAALVALDGRAVDADAAGARAPRSLVSAESAERLSVAAVRVVDAARGERFDYAQVGGTWRCVNAHGALALPNQVTDLVAELVGAVGEPRTSDPTRHVDYGIGAGQSIIVSLHGPRVASAPDADRLLAFELGASLPGPGDGRVFARIEGSDEVLELAVNPRARVERPEGDRLPPLLDRRVLAGEFPGPDSGVVRAFVDWGDGRSIELGQRALPPERVLPGRLPVEWLAREGDVESVCLPFRVAAWQAFLFRSNYAGFADPRDAAQMGLDGTPVVRVTLVLAEGDPIELQVGRRLEGGAAAVRNAKTGMLCIVAPEHVALFAPTVEMLSETALPNPWEAWLLR